MTAVIPLAQSTQTLSAATIGVLVLGLILLSRWLWDYNRSRREEAAQFEPKSNPALHLMFATKAELERVEREVAILAQEQRDDIAGLHQKIEGVERRLDARIDAVPDRTIKLLRETKGLIG